MTGVPLEISRKTIAMQAVDHPAFSNGTEWEAWSGRWCETCTHDDESSGGDVYCPLMTFALLGQRTPAQWHEGDQSLSGRYACTDYDPRPEVRDARG